MWVIEKKMISSYKKLWTKSLHYTIYSQPLKHVIKLSIQLNVFLDLYEWITCEFWFLHLIVPIQNTSYFRMIYNKNKNKNKMDYMWILVINIVAIISLRQDFTVEYK